MISSRAVGTHGYVFRTGDEQWQQVLKAAAADGVSVAEWLREAVQFRLDSVGSPSQDGTEAALRRVAEVSGQLARGWVLVPGSEAEASPGTGSWGSFLDHGESP